ncbi:hypothetical protein EDC01DRAFT_656937 [Geopyxis carbonaria]|nr:hypothetical protein EDC01DRAFT_656937 [Geopyxis carbonaria]
MRIPTAAALFAILPAALAKTCPSYLEFCTTPGASSLSDPDFAHCQRLYHTNPLAAVPQTANYKPLVPGECQALAAPDAAGTKKVWYARGEGEAVCYLYRDDECAGPAVPVVPVEMEVRILMGGVRAVRCEVCE